MVIFKIESLEVEMPRPGVSLRQYNCIMKASLTRYCDAHGNIQLQVQFKSEAKALTQDESVKQAIENFINGKAVSDHAMYASSSCTCPREEDSSIATDFSIFSPEQQELFQSLFDKNKWIIPLELQ